MKNEGCSVISVWILACLPVTGAACWKTKKHYFRSIIGFFVTPPLFLATKVAISFVYCSTKTIKCTQKPKIEKGLQESTNRVSECHSPHRIYNSLLRMRAIHELKKGYYRNVSWSFYCVNSWEAVVVMSRDFSFRPNCVLVMKSAKRQNWSFTQNSWAS